MPKQTLQQFGQSIKAKHPEYKDMDDAALGKAVLQKYPQYQDMVDVEGPEQATDAAGRTPSGQPAPGDTRNAFQRSVDELSTPDPRREEWQTPLARNAGNFGTSLAGAVLQPIAHPLNTLKGIGGAIAASRGNPAEILPEMVKPIIEKGIGDYEKHGAGYALSGAAGTGIGSAAAGEVGGALLRGAGDAGSAIRTAAIGDPNVAALKGLRVGPGSPKSISTVKAVEGARPFLQGAKSLEDLQGKLPGAKSEIWGPYQGTVDAIGDKVATGPDGPTTVRALEEERQQLSALNRKLKQQNPEAIQLAQQKGMTQAQLLDREKAVQQALDPHLEEAGIDPKLIRKTFGQVAQVSDRVSGKSTLAEEKQPYGFAKLKDFSLTKPLSNVPLAADAARDVVAGRYLSAKPTDVAIRDAFRLGGPKPDFRAPISAMPTGRPSFRLPAETAQNAEFSFPESRMLDSGIGHSQRIIASPEILPPDPHAVRLPRETSPQPVQAPDPQTLHTYPAGSAYRNLELGAPEYPIGSAFRPKAKPFNLDEYLKGTQ